MAVFAIVFWPCAVLIWWMQTILAPTGCVLAIFGGLLLVFPVATGALAAKADFPRPRDEGAERIPGRARGGRSTVASTILSAKPARAPECSGRDRFARSDEREARP